MNPIVRFFIFQMIIVLSFIGGAFIKKKSEKAEKYIEHILSLNLRVLEPLITFWSSWKLAISSHLLLLPFAGFSIVLFGFIFGKILAPLLHKDERSKLTFAVSSSISNQGFTMGAFICYIFLGEQGLGLAVVFMTYFPFWVYCFMFTYVRIKREHHRVTPLFILSSLFKFHNMPLFAVLLSIFLNAVGVHRPAIHINLDYILFPTVGLYFLMLGLSFEFNAISRYLKEAAIVSALRFVLLPLLVGAAVFSVNIPHAYRSVILLQSVMPVGVFSVVTANLFKLNVPLASALFVINTILFIILFVPAIYFLLPLLV
jgi:predicted permease